MKTIAEIDRKTFEKIGDQNEAALLKVQERNADRVAKLLLKHGYQKEFIGVIYGEQRHVLLDAVVYHTGGCTAILKDTRERGKEYHLEPATVIRSFVLVGD